MRKRQIEHRQSFLRGVTFGLMIIAVKLLVALPVDLANVLYGMSLSVTLVITFGDFVGWNLFVLHPKVLDLVLGFLFPLDAYAVLVLFGVQVPN